MSVGCKKKIRKAFTEEKRKSRNEEDRCREERRADIMTYLFKTVGMVGGVLEKHSLSPNVYSDYSVSEISSSDGLFLGGKDIVSRISLFLSQG